MDAFMPYVTPHNLLGCSSGGVHEVDTEALLPPPEAFVVYDQAGPRDVCMNLTPSNSPSSFDYQSKATAAPVLDNGQWTSVINDAKKIRNHSRTEGTRKV